MNMYGVVTTREIAYAVFFLLLLVYILYNNKTRKLAFNLAYSVLKRPIIIAFGLVFLYACVLIQFFIAVNIWEASYLKDVLEWVVFVGTPLCFKAVNHNDEHYFLNCLVINFKLTALLEVIIGSYTFPLVVELIIQPLFVLLIIINEFSKREKAYENLTRFTELISSIVGIWMLCEIIRQIIFTFSYSTTKSLIIAFLIPAIFSALYIPFAYLLAVYAKYEVVFKRMDYMAKGNGQIRINHRLAILKSCGVSYSRINKFQKDYLRYIYRLMSEEEFKYVIESFKKNETVDDDKRYAL